jgi:hypothetical protein
MVVLNLCILGVGTLFAVLSALLAIVSEVRGRLVYALIALALVYLTLMYLRYGFQHERTGFVLSSSVLMFSVITSWFAWKGRDRSDSGGSRKIQTEREPATKDSGD